MSRLISTCQHGVTETGYCPRCEDGQREEDARMQEAVMTRAETIMRGNDGLCDFHAGRSDRITMLTQGCKMCYPQTAKERVIERFKQKAPGVLEAWEIEALADKAIDCAERLTKDTNPKDAIGSTKLDMGLVPDTFIAEIALAFTEGALKYGRYNWRVAGVRASIYHAALRRHMAKWWNGENLDPQTGVSHLASAAACIAVLIDGAAVGKLTDDRPPRARNMGLILHDAEAQVKELKRTFAEHNPHQYTIDDGE